MYLASQYAAVMGIKKDLDLTGNRFSNVATFLFVGLLCFEIPNSKLLPIYDDDAMNDTRRQPPTMASFTSHKPLNRIP